MNTNSIGYKIFKSRYAVNPQEEWRDLAKRVATLANKYVSTDTLQDIEEMIFNQEFIPAGRVLANAGKINNQYSNCLATVVGDSKEEWAKSLHNISLALMKQYGVGVELSQVRPRGSLMKRSGGIASGSVSFAHMLNEVSRHIKAGGLRRVAMLGSLVWNHQDLREFVEAKILSPEQIAARQIDYEFPTPLDMMNISIRLDNQFFHAYASGDTLAQHVFDYSFDRMLQQGEPGLLVNRGTKKDDIYVNPCGEFRVSESDTICVLGSINLAAMRDIKHFEDTVELATHFLMSVREETELPYEGAKKENIGLGVMGLANWLAYRNYSYETPQELENWLDLMSLKSHKCVKDFIKRNSCKPAQYTIAIAPTGSISMLTGIMHDIPATPGIEPLFCKAYVRRWYGKTELNTDVVIEPLALLFPDIDDSYSLSSIKGYEKRIKMLRTIQDYVDMGISVTINLPEDALEHKAAYKDITIKNLAHLRGLTLYREGSRGISPLTPISVEEAKKMKPKIESSEQECNTGMCGL